MGLDRERAGMTLRVRHALRIMSLEDSAHDLVTALGVRGLMVVEREKWTNEAWLSEQLDLLRLSRGESAEQG